MTGSMCSRSVYSSVRMTSLFRPGLGEPGAHRAALGLPALPVGHDAGAQGREERKVPRQHAELAVDARSGDLVHACRERATRGA